MDLGPEEPAVLLSQPEVLAKMQELGPAAVEAGLPADWPVRFVDGDGAEASLVLARPKLPSSAFFAVDLQVKLAEFGGLSIQVGGTISESVPSCRAMMLSGSYSGAR